MGREGKLLDQASFGLSQDPGTVPPSKRGSSGAPSRAPLWQGLISIALNS